MTQQAVQDYLKENGKEYYTAREVAEHFGICLASATKNLKGLRQTGTVVFRFRDSLPGWPKEYKYKDMSKVRV